MKKILTLMIVHCVMALITDQEYCSAEKTCTKYGIQEEDAIKYAPVLMIEGRRCSRSDPLAGYISTTIVNNVLACNHKCHLETGCEVFSFY